MQYLPRVAHNTRRKNKPSTTTSLQPLRITKSYRLFTCLIITWLLPFQLRLCHSFIGCFLSCGFNSNYLFFCYTFQSRVNAMDRIDNFFSLFCHYYLYKQSLFFTLSLEINTLECHILLNCCWLLFDTKKK